jgi:uncharacterized membrane protein
LFALGAKGHLDMTLLILGLIFFLGTHSFSRFRAARDGLAARLGPMPFRGLYSLPVLIGFVLIIIGYGQYRAAGYIPLWTPPAALKHLSYLLMMPVFVLLIAAYVPGKIKAAVVHPMLAAVKLWALAHLLVNGDLGSVLMFGGFLAWGLFARIRLGKAQRVAAPWTIGDTIAVVGGLAGWIATLLWLHPILIGVPAVG